MRHIKNMSEFVRGAVGRALGGKGSGNFDHGGLDDVWGGSSKGGGGGGQELKIQAKKFKTAEEFVGSQGKVLFRGGKTEGNSFSSVKGIADAFAANRGGSVTEHILSPSAKIVQYKDVPDVLYKGITDDSLNSRKDNLEFAETVLEKEFVKATKWAKENGFNAIQLPIESEIRIINKEQIKAKQQLINVWKEVHKR